MVRALAKWLAAPVIGWIPLGVYIALHLGGFSGQLAVLLGHSQMGRQR